MGTVLEMSSSIPGLYPAFIRPGEHNQKNQEFTLGGLADSFYEYLLKMWLISGKKDTVYRDHYIKAADAAIEHLYAKNGKKLGFFGAKKHGSLEHEMEHLVSFFPAI
jgi:mannosyl-oligosaccharide alpha-1,2-mannosidase